MRRGDIDGQIKTLFDALGIPENTEETANATPDKDEQPFFCLLQDDRLVTEVRVTTDAYFYYLIKLKFNRTIVSRLSTSNSVIGPREPSKISSE